MKTLQNYLKARQHQYKLDLAKYRAYTDEQCQTDASLENKIDLLHGRIIELEEILEFITTIST